MLINKYYKWFQAFNVGLCHIFFSRPLLLLLEEENIINRSCACLGFFNNFSSDFFNSLMFLWSHIG
jgi:hypothetical protein